MCSLCSPRYLDGIKLLQRGGGGRVGRGCWGGGQLLVIIKYSRIGYRTELRCLWCLKAKNVIKILEEVEKKHESQAAAKYIHCEYPLAEKKTLVNITFYVCIKSFLVSDSESSESESEDVIEDSYFVLSEVVRVCGLHARRDWREVVLLRKSLRHLW